MKLNVKRCFTLFCCILLLAPFLAQSAYATKVIGVEGAKWNYVLIHSEESMSTPNVVIIYLHGNNSTGNSIESLESLGRIEHPVKYANEGTLWLPDDTIMVCPQGNYNGQFLNEQEELEKFIHGFREIFPDAIIILSGASNGCLASYKIAATENPDVDGYCFISGIKPGGSKKLSLVHNSLVVYGDESWLSYRSDYSALFPEIDIGDDEYRQLSFYWHEETNNAYFRGPWHHGNTPLIFLEDFFWEWVNNFL